MPNPAPPWIYPGALIEQISDGSHHVITQCTQQYNGPFWVIIVLDRHWEGSDDGPLYVLSDVIRSYRPRPEALPAGEALRRAVQASEDWRQMDPEIFDRQPRQHQRVIAQQVAPNTALSYCIATFQFDPRVDWEGPVPEVQTLLSDQERLSNGFPTRDFRVVATNQFIPDRERDGWAILHNGAYARIIQLPILIRFRTRWDPSIAGANGWDVGQLFRLTTPVGPVYLGVIEVNVSDDTDEYEVFFATDRLLDHYSDELFAEHLEFVSDGHEMAYPSIEEGDNHDTLRSELDAGSPDAVTGRTMFDRLLEE